MMRSFYVACDSYLPLCIAAGLKKELLIDEVYYADTG